MSRTEVANARDAAIEAVRVWRVEAGGDWRANLRLLTAVDALVKAEARVSVDSPDVYTSRDGRGPELAAAQAAMLSRPTWRKLIYTRIGRTELLFPASDRRLELFFANAAGRDYHGQRVPLKVSHQTISSARKSLVDVGLIYAFGTETHEGRAHTTWRVRPPQRLETTCLTPT